MMTLFPTTMKTILENMQYESKRGTIENSREVVSRLKFISMIKRDEKINVKTLYIQPKNMFTSFSRLFQQESRDSTKNFLNTTYNRIFEILTLYSCSDDKDSDRTVVINLVKDLHMSISGLENLQYTYSDDRMFVSEINTLIEDIQRHIRCIRRKKPHYFLEEISTESNLDHDSLHESTI